MRGYVQNVGMCRSNQLRTVRDGIAHYSDDHSWAFVCGTTDATEDARVIGMGEAARIDPTLYEIADLPPGWTAHREKVGAIWHKVPDQNAFPSAELFSAKILKNSLANQVTNLYTVLMIVAEA